MARGRRGRAHAPVTRRDRARGARAWPPGRPFAEPRAKRRAREQAVKELLARERREVIGLIVEVAAMVGVIVIVIVVVVVLAHAGHR